MGTGMREGMLRRDGDMEEGGSTREQGSRDGI